MCNVSEKDKLGMYIIIKYIFSVRVYMYVYTILCMSHTLTPVGSRGSGDPQTRQGVQELYCLETEVEGMISIGATLPQTLVN